MILINIPENFPESIGHPAVASKEEKALSVASWGTLAACKIGVASTSAASESQAPSTYSTYCDVIDIDPGEHDPEMQQAIYQSTRRRSTDDDERYDLCSKSFSVLQRFYSWTRGCKGFSEHPHSPSPRHRDLTCKYRLLRVATGLKMRCLRSSALVVRCKRRFGETDVFKYE